jgi:hypothetical protein
VLICAALSVSASRVRVACCEKSQSEDISETPFPAAPSLPVALGFFGEQARCVVVVGRDPRTPLFSLRSAWPLRLAPEGKQRAGCARVRQHIAAHTGRDSVGATIA